MGGIQLEIGSAPPPHPCPRGHLCITQPSCRRRIKERGWGGRGTVLGCSQSRHSQPPRNAPSLPQRPGVGRGPVWAVPAPGTPPRPPPRAPSCSSSPACAATPAWTGPAPTSRSRSGSWRAPSGRPAWTPEVGAGGRWGSPLQGCDRAPTPALRPPRVPQAAPVPAAAGGEREHGPGGPGPPRHRHHPVHRPHRRRRLPPRGRPLPALPRQPPTLSRQVFFSR